MFNRFRVRVADLVKSRIRSQDAPPDSKLFAMGGPFAALGWYKPVFGTVILVLVTLTIPVLEKFFVGAVPVSGSDSGAGGGNAPDGASANGSHGAGGNSGEGDRLRSDSGGE